MDNTFRVFGSDEAVAEFLRSSIKSSEEVIVHYDFVIQDISSTISDPVLEAAKAPTIEFLKAMKGQWEGFQSNLKRDLKSFETNASETDGGSR